jgi:hypothetical protein
MKICENCQCEHNGSYGSGRFCSEKCSRSFVTKAKRKEINEKISKKLSNLGHAPIIKLCSVCNNQFTVNWAKRTQQYCSKKCSGKINGILGGNAIKSNTSAMGGFRPNGGRP